MKKIQQATRKLRKMFSEINNKSIFIYLEVYKKSYIYLYIEAYIYLEGVLYQRE